MYLFPVGLCSLPSNWDGDWYHSGKTDVVISGRTKSITSGWDVTVSSTPLTTWSCVTSNDTDSYLLFKYIVGILQNNIVLANQSLPIPFSIKCYYSIEFNVADQIRWSTIMELSTLHSVAFNGQKSPIIPTCITQ